MAIRNRNIRNRFSHEKAIIFGVLLIVCGITAIVLSAVGIAKKLWGHYLGAGVWSGALFVLCGCLGIAASRRRTSASIAAYMISAVFAAVGALAALAISGLGIAYENHNAYKVVHILMMVVAVVSILCAMVSAVVGCRATCRNNNSPVKSRPPSGRTSPPVSEMSLTTPIYRPQSSNNSEGSAVTLSGDRRHHRTSRSHDRHSRSDRDRTRSDRPHSRSGHRDRDREHYLPPRMSERRLSTEPLHPALSDMNPPAPVQQTQQITIVTPFSGASSAPSVYSMPGTYVMQTAGVGGFSQVMYVMPPAPPVAPSTNADRAPDNDDSLFPPGTPPPSYSPLDPRLVQEVLSQQHEHQSNAQQADEGVETPSLSGNSDAPPSGSQQNLGAGGGVVDDLQQNTPDATPPSSRAQTPRPPPHPPTPLPESAREQQIHRRTPLQTVL